MFVDEIDHVATADPTTPWQTADNYNPARALQRHRPSQHRHRPRPRSTPGQLAGEHHTATSKPIAAIPEPAKPPVR